MMSRNRVFRTVPSQSGRSNMAAAKTKTVDRQDVIARLTKSLKKEFGTAPKREATPVLEMMVFALCLEDSGFEAARTVVERLKKNFFDWNEIRVSTISELEPVFAGLHQPEWRAFRVRGLLYYVFDHQYSYDFDAIKKKTQELAQKQLQKIKHLTPFVRNYLLQSMMGNHIIPVDQKMIRLAVWLGLLPFGIDPEGAADTLKSLVRKSEGPEFFWLLKSVSVCEKAIPVADHPGFDIPADEALETADSRLTDLLAGKAARLIELAKARQVENKASKDPGKTAAKGSKAQESKASESKAADSKVAVGKSDEGKAAASAVRPPTKLEPAAPAKAASAAKPVKAAPTAPAESKKAAEVSTPKASASKGSAPKTPAPKAVVKKAAPAKKTAAPAKKSAPAKKAAAPAKKKEPSKSETKPSKKAAPGKKAAVKGASTKKKSGKH